MTPLGHARALPRTAWRRVRPELLPLAEAAFAGALAWRLARLLHPQPIFAPIAALISMRAAVGRRGQQAVHMILGITLGILIAEGLIRGIGAGAWQLGVGVLVGMAIPTALGLPPLVVTQTAVWCILVVALGRQSGSYAVGRFIDGLIGGAVALVLVQLVFPADPHRLVSRAAGPLFEEVAATLVDVAGALEAHDEERARAALRRIESVDDSAFRDALVTARSIVRRAPTRRRRRSWLEPYAAAAGALDAIERDVAMLAVAVVRRVREERAAPRQLVDALHRLAIAYRSLPDRLRPHDPADSVAHALAEVEATLERTPAEDGLTATLLRTQLEALVRDARRAAALKAES